MKYIITESKFESVIFDYFDNLFEIDNITTTNPYEEDDETGEEYYDDTRVEFYIGNPEDENDIFQWYACEYFDEGANVLDKCPLVSLVESYEDTLNAYFGDKWKEPFKKWFRENFDLPVKHIH